MRSAVVASAATVRAIAEQAASQRSVRTTPGNFRMKSGPKAVTGVWNARRHRARGEAAGDLQGRRGRERVAFGRFHPARRLPPCAVPGLRQERAAGLLARRCRGTGGQPVDAAVDQALRGAARDDAPDAGGQAGRRRHGGEGLEVDIDVRDAGRVPRARHVAPAEPDGPARSGAEIGGGPRRARQFDDAPVPAHPRAPGDALHHGAGRATAEAAESADGDAQVRRPGQSPGHVGREAVARHHVEARRRQEDDAGGLRLCILGRESLQHRDLAGDVDVVCPRREAGLGHRPRGSRERAGRVDHRRHAREGRAQTCAVVEARGPHLQAQPGCQRPQLVRIAPRQDRAQPLRDGVRGQELPGIAGGAVDQDRGHPGVLTPLRPVSKRAPRRRAGC